MIARWNDAWRFAGALRRTPILGALALLASLSGCYYYGNPNGYRDGYYGQPYSGNGGSYYNQPGDYGQPGYGGYAAQPGYGGGYYNQPGYGGGYNAPPPYEGGGTYGQPYARGNSHTLPPLPYYGEEGG